MKTARYAAAAVAFLTPAAWLLMLLGCVRWSYAPACEPVNYAAAPLAIGAVISAWFGLIHWTKAHRTATRGMWRRVPGLGAWRVMSHGIKALWEGEAGEGPAIIGEARFIRRRWLVPVRNGQRVCVDRREFWLWLDEVEKLHRTLPPGESALSERRWKRKLKEGKYLAYCAILEAVGAVEYQTDDARSRRYVPGLAWSRVEEFEGMVKSEEY